MSRTRRGSKQNFYFLAISTTQSPTWINWLFKQISPPVEAFITPPILTAPHWSLAGVSLALSTTVVFPAIFLISQLWSLRRQLAALMVSSLFTRTSRSKETGPAAGLRCKVCAKAAYPYIRTKDTLEAPERAPEPFYRATPGIGCSATYEPSQLDQRHAGAAIDVWRVAAVAGWAEPTCLWRTNLNGMPTPYAALHVTYCIANNGAPTNCCTSRHGWLLAASAWAKTTLRTGPWIGLVLRFQNLITYTMSSHFLAPSRQIPIQCPSTSRGQCFVASARSRDNLQRMQVSAYSEACLQGLNVLWFMLGITPPSA
jgi:hypothetical protein